MTTGVAVITSGAALHIAPTRITGAILILLRLASVLTGLGGLATLRLHGNPMSGRGNFSCGTGRFFARPHRGGVRGRAGLTRNGDAGVRDIRHRTAYRSHDAFGFRSRSGSLGSLNGLSLLGFRTRGCGCGLSIGQGWRGCDQCFFGKSLRKAGSGSDHLLALNRARSLLVAGGWDRRCGSRRRNRS